MHFLDKVWKILENLKILNWSQQKENRNYLVSEPNYYTTVFHRISNSNGNEKKLEKLLINFLI